MRREPSAVGIAAGDGLIARFGPVLVYLAGDTASTDRILGTVEAVSNAEYPGAALAQRLAAVVFGSGSEPPPFGVVAPTADGTLILLRGAVTAEINGAEGTRRLSGARAFTWVDEIVREPVRRISVGTDSAAPVTERPRTDLRDGIVPGGGFVLRYGTVRRTGRPASATGTAAPQPATAPQSAPSGFGTPGPGARPGPGRPQSAAPWPGNRAAPTDSPTIKSAAPTPGAPSGPTGASRPDPASDQTQSASAPGTAAAPTPFGASRSAEARPGTDASRSGSSAVPTGKPQLAKPWLGKRSATIDSDTTESVAPTSDTPSGPTTSATPKPDATSQPPTSASDALSDPALSVEPKPGVLSAGSATPSDKPSIPTPASGRPRSSSGAGQSTPEPPPTAAAGFLAGPDDDDPIGNDTTVKAVGELAETRASPLAWSEVPEQQEPTALHKNPAPNSGPGATRGRVREPHPNRRAPDIAPGVLIAPDGTPYPLDRPYVIGRSPHADEAVRAATAAPLIIQRDRHVSRVHAYLSIDRGKVFLRDAATPAGTFVAAPGAEQWTRIGTTPTELPPGWSIRIGERILTYRLETRRRP